MAQSQVKAASENDLTPAGEETLDFDDGTLRATAESYKNEGNNSYRQNDFNNAIYFYTEGIKVDCKDEELKAKLYSNRANAYFCLGKYTDSLTDAKVACSLQPSYLKAIFTGASACFQLKQFEEAITWCKKGLAIDKNNQKLVELRRKSVNEYNKVRDTTGGEDSDFTTFLPKTMTKPHSGARQVSDGSEEGEAYGNNDIDYKNLGNFRKAIECHEKRLKIAKEVGDRSGEGTAYGNLGNAYHSLGNFQKAIEYHEKHLKIAKEVGDRSGEGTAYGNLGIAYRSLGNFQKAIEYHEKHLKIAKEVGDRSGEGRAYGNLGNAYLSLGNFQKAMEYHEKRLKIAKEVGDRSGEGTAYGNLGNAYLSLGSFQKAIEYNEKHLKIAKEVGDRSGEGRAYGNLGNAYDSLGNFQKAIEYHEKHLKIAKEVGDRSGEGKAYGHLGNAYHSLGNFQKAIEYHEKHLKIAKEVGNRSGEGGAYGSLGNAYRRLSNFQKAIEYHEKHLKIAKEVDDRCGEGKAYANLGNAYDSLGKFQKAFECYQGSVCALDIVRALITSEDALKISFRDLYRGAYRLLWQSLLKLGRTDESLRAAEQGRAQTLADSLKRQYGLTESPPASLQPKETISYISSKVSTKTVFLGHRRNNITFWVISKGSKVEFREKKLEQGRVNEDAVIVLLDATLEKIGAGVRVACENRSLDELNNRDVDDKDEEDEDKQGVPPQCTIDALQPLHDAILGPISDLCKGNELIIVPDGPLCLAPFSALSTSIRIRTVPSLTSLRLITDCPEEFKSNQEALLVGDPYLGDVKKSKFNELPYAKEEVEVIGEILKIPPLTGTEATKDEVLKRMTSAALVHIAAHGKKETGEIALAPNPGWEKHYDGSSRSKAKNKGPKEDDYMLKMSDVQAVKLRAKLVVLSCCHSGRGEIKSEGVVGIARAFLAAGARSVLASLWAISDQATLEFMKSFYQHLGDGKTASVALHQAMKYLRESKQFFAVKHWAPFVLIGDDIHLNLDAKKQSPKMMLEK